MDIYKFAYKMEKDSESYYNDLAKNTNHEGFKKILIMLAQEERKHQDYVTSLKENNNIKYVESDVLNNVKNIFEEIKKKKEKIATNNSQIDLYKKAQELEKKSEDFYKEKSKESKNLTEKKLFDKLSEEERKHYILLDDIIEFVNKPSTWIENAEFNHTGEEY
jgi:rubrerythrin